MTDPTTGSLIHFRQYRFVVTLLDDAAYYGIMVYLYDMTGVNRWFLPLAETLASDPLILQALRYGLMFSTMNELRRWLDTWMSTELSTHIESVLSLWT